ncbi:MAG TPA: non-homologous end-joining DNA ligase, partial [Bryobacteraceae bacterium]|nr:non-homologous end-joining DNA ligase [Bryobacteraceae bacterium]
YIRVSPWLLPHLKDRPVTMKRYPNGVGGEHFYEKDAPGFTPDWVQTFPVPRRAGGPDIRYILINDLPTLVWTANLANLEIHPFLHCVPAISNPTSVVFDLDPGEGADVVRCAEVAFLLRTRLGELGLDSYPKVSGSKGLQVYVPLNQDATYDATQPFAKSLAQRLAREYPRLIVAEMAKNLRAGKVFIDWSQNSDFKTTVGVYSMRAKRQTPFVSMPVSWEELEAALQAGKGSELYWQPSAAITRLETTGDLFAPVLTQRQHLPQAVKSTASRPAAPKSLGEYKKKRNFAVTAEPEPAPPPRRSRQGGRRRFVVQKHAASHLHYDFRLEMHDVLKSWAVPKGVPYGPDERRLAMATEDHPLEYLDFEGVIPEGQYGGGTVMVWDIGTYDVVDGNYYKGLLHIHLSGSKLKGEWQLVRDPAKGERNWVLTKVPPARKPQGNEDRSAISDRTMEEIAAARDAVWHSNRDTGPAPDFTGAVKSPAVFVDPMHAKLSEVLPEGKGWSYEAKFDGYRVLGLKSDGTLRLLSRRNNDLTADFPTVARALESLDDETIVDGEIVALDEEGRPLFNLLQNRGTGRGAIQFYAFDVLFYRGHKLLDLPLERRRQLLTHALASVPQPVLLSQPLTAAPAALINAVKELGLEGILAKRTDSRYESGKRSGSWVKFKVNQDQELVIGGYIPAPTRHFDALLVGYYQNNKLVFAGKIRNGFKDKGSKERVFALFHGLGTDQCPFSNLPEPKNARRGMALTAEAMKLCCWLKPELVAQVAIREWTTEGHLRHAAFVAMRDDKDPRDVVRESPG